MRTDYLVYAHTRLDTGAVFYIGKGTDVRVRKNSNRNIYWKRIVAKDNGFGSLILAKNLTEKEALNFEILMIKKSKEAGIGICNLTNGGDGVSGYKRSLESRKEQSQRMLGKTPPNKGKPASKEAIEKMRLAKLGKKQSPQHIENFRKARMGHIVSDATKAKLSAIFKGRIIPEEQYAHRRKPVVCITTNEIFKSVSEASKKFDIPTTNISRCCSGVFKQTKGYVFEYVTTSEMTL